MSTTANDIIINIKVDNKQALDQLNKTSGTGKAVAAQVGKAFAGLGIVAAGAIGVGMVGPLAAAVLALGAFGAVALPTLDKVKKALTTTGTAGQKAFAALSAPQRELYGDVRRLQGGFDQLQKSMAPVVSRVADLAVKVGAALLPAIGGLAKAGASILTDFFTPLLRLLQSNFFAGFVRQMSALATQFAPALGQALVKLLKAFMQLFEQAGPAGEKVLSGLLSLLVKWVVNLIPFITWVTKAAAAIGQWMAANKAVAISLILVGAAVAIATGGLSLIIPAILAVIAAMTYLWRHSSTFRDVVTQVASNVAHAFIQMALVVLRALHSMADDALAFAGIAIHAMAAAFGWVPGLGPKLKAAAANFDGFRSSVDGVFNKLHGTLEGWKAAVDKIPHVIKIQGDITDLTAKLATANRELSNPNLTKTRKAAIIADNSILVAAINRSRQLLAALNGTTVYTYIQAVQTSGGTGSGNPGGGLAHGGITGAAAGGVRGRLTMVGEHGRELVKLPAGSYVHSNPDTERIMGQGSGGGRLVLEMKGAPMSGLEALFIRWLREWIRNNGGGSVQTALGR